MFTGELGFLWISEIINSGYQEGGRYRMASQVVQLLEKYYYSEVLERPSDVRPAWTPPLLGFLSLSEKFYTTKPALHSGFIALHILSASYPSADFGPVTLPVLASTLLPSHPLQSRNLALKVFHRFMSGWFSPQMENVLHEDLNKLLQAVGDPFQFTASPPLHAGSPVGTANYKPMKATVVLMEFASSDLWRNHLCRSNFTSCEETVSTEEGRGVALRCMLDTATHSLPEFLCTPTKITAAIRRLEELQCLNTAEVVIMWAWTSGVINPVDDEAWRFIGRETLRFYQTHGIGRLAALKQHITSTTMKYKHIEFLRVHYERPPCRVGSVRRRVPIGDVPRLPWSSGHYIDLRVSQVCQLRRLHHLFGHCPNGVEGGGSS